MLILLSFVHHHQRSRIPLNKPTLSGSVCHMSFTATQDHIRSCKRENYLTSAHDGQLRPTVSISYNGRRGEPPPGHREIPLVLQELQPQTPDKEFPATEWSTPTLQQHLTFPKTLQHPTNMISAMVCIRQWGSNTPPNVDHQCGSNTPPNVDHQWGSNTPPNVDHQCGSNTPPNVDHQWGSNTPPNV